MKKTVVLNVVGLTPELINEHTPHLQRFHGKSVQARVQDVLPAVTCSVQSTFLTGKFPKDHGIVGNGWYFRDECEVRFWRQSNKLVESRKIWDVAREIDPDFTCANLFWWYNMYSLVDYAVTPRPMYPADGRKLPDIYTHPANIREELQRQLGPFPLFDFWGPATSVKSSQWIADASMWVDRRYNPTLTLIYLPHLDYCLQRHGPDVSQVAQDLSELDAVCGELIEYYDEKGAEIIILSEYGIDHVSSPMHLNRELREHGMIAVREELGRELLDAGASKAFAVADHQVAHVYLNDPSALGAVQELIRGVRGVDLVLDEEGQRAYGLDHPRAGELVAVAEPGAWFTYYYWMDDDRAPDFARTVDIHRKPGYDPVELFLDPEIRFPKVKIGSRLLKKKLGFRYLMDVIPLDATLVRGSHGRPSTSVERAPLFMTRRSDLLENSHIDAVDVFRLVMECLEVERM